MQNSLVSLLRSGLTPFFAVRDFNISPAMLKTKFKIPTESFRFPPYEERYALSSEGEAGAGGAGPAAGMSRDSLGRFVERAQTAKRVAAGASRLLIMSAAGSVLGLLLVFFALARSAFQSASVGNLTFFMALWTAASVLLSDAASDG